jgi:hypothetical protein
MVGSILRKQVGTEGRQNTGTDLAGAFMNPRYFVLGRKIYEQTDHANVYRMIEKNGETSFLGNLHIESLKRAGAKGFEIFGEARLEASK